MNGYHILLLLRPKHSHPEFTPTSLFEPLPSQKPQPTARRNAVFNPKNQDYRFGPIRIDWLDFDTMNKAGHSRIEKDGHGALLLSSPSQ
jgi:BRCA1-associated protein